MTFKQWMESYCVGMGMFREQAEPVVQKITSAPDNPMAGRWNESIHEYPATIRALLVLQINQAATAWIEENLPNAWFKPLFQTQEKP